MKIDKAKILIISLIAIFNFSFYSDVYAGPVDSLDQKYLNWFNKDAKTEEVYGIGTDRAYEELLMGKVSQTVIVAVIDSGIDVDHEDLKANIWINEKEIPGNNVDDDQNGYTDDIHGWNFLGNASGENITFERFEITRNYERLKKKFEGKTKSTISKEEQTEFDLFLAVKKDFLQALEKAKEEQSTITRFGKSYYHADAIIMKHLGEEEYSHIELKNIKTEDEQLMAAKDFLLALYEKGLTKERLKEYEKRCENTLKYHLNPDFNPRTVVGDNPEDPEEFQYGNNDVTGDRASHGTHVAGIIAGVRNNGLGIDGIAENVKVMALRAVPDGDERDKDIANAIRYAVNNGAQVINMSFGKNSSTHREAVEEAIRLCEEKGVLLVHAAGNEGLNTDKEIRFPTNIYMDASGKAPNFLNVGATSTTPDKTFIASFSNYGKQNVDIFAPGVDIYSLAPENKYELNSGTSMASPMVTGLAALLLSYYPSLTALEVKEILYKSATKPKRLKVYLPNSDKGKKQKVRFASLSASGGVINAYEAVKLADKLVNGK